MTDEWTNLFAMIEDLHAHVRTTGRPVVMDDDPRARKLGYRDPDTGKVWKISLLNMKLSSQEVPKTERWEVYMDLLRTQAGRERLANFPLAAPPV